MKYVLLFLTLGALLLLSNPVMAQFQFEECSTTEAWLPMGEGLPKHARLSTTLDGVLYVLGSDDDSTYDLSRWDGERWITVSQFVTTATNLRRGTVSDMVAYNGAIYIRGCFSSIVSVPGTSGFARWDGTAWSGVAGCPLDGSPYPIAEIQDRVYSKMTVYKGELVVSGPFKRTDGVVHLGVLLWNGTRWLTIAEENSAPLATDSLGITAYAEWRGDLYVAGTFRRIGGINARGIARWDGTSWSAVGNANIRTVRQLFVFRDRLYALRSLDNTSTDLIRPGDEYVVEWDGTSWRNLPDVYPRYLKALSEHMLLHTAVSVFDDKVYLSVVHLFSEPDVVRCWDGTTSRIIARPDSGIVMLVPHDRMLIAGGYFTWSCGRIVRNIAQLCLGKECGGISGRVVETGSGDCDHDAGAQGIAGHIVEVDRVGYAVSDSDGFYRLYPPAAGEYRVALVPERHRDQTCPTAPPYRIARIATSGDSSAGNNFGVRAVPGIRDLRVGVVSGVARRGRAIEYVLTCTNMGTVPVKNQMLVFRPNARLMYKSSTLEPSRSTGQELEWDMDMLEPRESRNIRLSYTVPTDWESTSDLCASIGSYLSDDAWPTDNLDSICTPVIASFDPNDIAVHPAGSGADGVILPHDSVLTYTVRFQNTGYDTAFSVVVYDTLDRNLDLTSLMLGPSSHPFKLHFEGTSTLAWEFPDIGLPSNRFDSTRSQGFFKYSVRLKPGLAPSTRIANRASIYFDYNAPIVTNTVISTIPAPASSVESEPVAEATLGVYPNPARGLVHLRGNIVRGSAIEVRSMLGVVVRSVWYEGSGDAAVDLEGLAAGVYMVSVRTAAGDMAVRVTLVK